METTTLERIVNEAPKAFKIFMEFFSPRFNMELIGNDRDPAVTLTVFAKNCMLHGDARFLYDFFDNNRLHLSPFLQVPGNWVFEIADDKAQFIKGENGFASRQAAEEHGFLTCFLTLEAGL
ncbi:hypothetical protein HGH93_23510 [Chitinophaga polysaccharea]|uniref:hypothetical protein n=1 Tax=Chitinophaga polysaccharea TaxID=1293035 RepID=UPI0014550352|nr:hypothetical protein [Chitinophaga polysaccharea]NLR61089.1 hypothetical protein [Chitinophaga polysaccharea]